MAGGMTRSEPVTSSPVLLAACGSSHGHGAWKVAPRSPGHPACAGAEAPPASAVPVV